MIDLISRPRFFVGTVVDPACWPRLLAVGLGEADGLAIVRTVSTGSDVASGVSGLSL